MEINYSNLIIGTIITEVIFVGILLFVVDKSKNVSKWYRDFALGAVLSDITVITLCILIARFLYTFLFDKFNIFKFIGLAIVIQIIHDILFSRIIMLFPPGNSRIINIFKSYSETAGYGVLFTDSMMVASSIIFMKLIDGFSLNQKMFTLILSLYLLPYFLYSY